MRGHRQRAGAKGTVTKHSDDSRSTIRWQETFKEGRQNRITSGINIWRHWRWHTHTNSLSPDKGGKDERVRVALVRTQRDRIDWCDRLGDQELGFAHELQRCYIWLSCGTIWAGSKRMKLRYKRTRGSDWTERRKWRTDDRMRAGVTKQKMEDKCSGAWQQSEPKW